MDPYTVPFEVSRHIDFVGGVNHLPNLQPRKQSRKQVTSNKGWWRLPANQVLVSPDTIRRVMNVDVLHATAANNSQAIAQFLQEYYSPQDLAAFQKRYNITAHNVSSILGPNDEQSPGVETALDIQYITAMAPGVETWVVSTGGLHDGQEPFLECGDDGTGCTKTCDTYIPGWPASSKYVLAVGGVVLKTGDKMDGDRISGGGFSNNFGIPDYQKDEVANYQKSLNDSTTQVLYNPKLTPIGGTSASTPIVAGLLSLINDRRLNEGKPSIGFVNPLIYKLGREHPDAFTDIQTGENINGCCTKGFKSAVGWDPVTGLGVPNFKIMNDYFNNLPRYANTVGLVLEQKRTSDSVDCLRWYCDNQACREIIFEESFTVSGMHLGKELAPIMTRFYETESMRTCKKCGHISQKPLVKEAMDQ
eukprot:gene5745-6648_t